MQLPAYPERLDWFSLHVWSSVSPEGVEAGWTFRSVDPERAVRFADPALELLVRDVAELPTATSLRRKLDQSRGLLRHRCWMESSS